MIILTLALILHIIADNDLDVIREITKQIFEEAWIVILALTIGSKSFYD